MMPVRRFTPAAVITALLGCGGGGASAPSSPTPPAVTAAGTPIGVATTKVVGAAGGAVNSDDAFFTVIIPAGALGSDVTIGIQPITAESPGATRAYRLTPEGTTFVLPVTVAFNYAPDDIAGSAPELLWIASQQGDGTWLLAPGVTVDTVLKQVSVTTTHFSDWTQLYGVQIRPPGGSLKPGESLNLAVVSCTNIVETSTATYSVYAIDCQRAPVPAGEDDLPDLPPLWRVDASSWAVNGIQGGSRAVGFVAGQDMEAEYLAPATAPRTGNPVAVSVKIRKKSNGAVLSTVVSNIEIVPVCGPASSRHTDGAALIDVCNLDWSGKSSTIFFDAAPLYKLEATLQWHYDTAATAAQTDPNVVIYYATGTATLTPLDTCVSLSQSTVSLGKDIPARSGALRIRYGSPVPTYAGNGTAQWLANVSDRCDPGSTPVQQPIGGAFFIGEGNLLLPPDYTRIEGTQSVGGQTFTFRFDRQGSVVPLRRRD